MTFFRSTLAAAGLIALASCSTTDAGEDRDEASLNIIRLADDAPPLFNPEVSGWVRRGQEREFQIYFRNAQGGQGDEFLELEFDEETLLAYPDGRPFGPRDSVFIRLRVIDVSRILFEFEPAGLRFNPREPAELEISYRLANADLNGDGRVDERDREVERSLAIWRQTRAGLPFRKLGTLQIEDLSELEADLDGFSRLAIAY